MSITERSHELRQVGAKQAARAATRVAAARTALGLMGRRASDMTATAQSRARDELERRRDAAAARLENWAEIVRPRGQRTDRRRTLAIVGGSSLALAAALGAGVALGFALSRQLKKRRAAQIGGPTRAQETNLRPGAQVNEGESAWMEFPATADGSGQSTTVGKPRRKPADATRTLPPRADA